MTHIIDRKWKASFLISMQIIVLLLILLLCLSSCAVKQWQREYLSDPIMRLDDDTESLEMRQHILERREGGVTGQDASGGGCGC